MPSGTGAIKVMNEFPERGFDVGIAEPHAVTMGAAMGKAGLKPVTLIYSSFSHRTVDQVFHDVLLQEDVPTCRVLTGRGLSLRMVDASWRLYDISVFRGFPGIIIASPVDLREVALLLRWAVDSGKVVALRYPRGSIPALPEVKKMPPVEEGKGYMVEQGEDVCIIGYGSMVRNALDAAKKLRADGISAGVANARFAKPIDRDLVSEASKSKLVVTVEEHTVEGGFGAIVAEELRGRADMLKIGVPDRFVEHGTREQLHKIVGLDPDSIANSIRKELGK
ncbi:MAG: transketolase C-terminal domain-containing protein [Planctomycetota bacterium]|nr:transketolase C-terminal domain-containing protein [Planctomycetota bacterium]